MNEVLKSIAERSSIRSYTQEPLTEEEIKTLVTSRLQAPTARNEQEVHISVLKGDNSILLEIEKERKEIILNSKEDETIKENVRNNPNNFYYNAPTVLILSVDKNFYWSKLDAGISVENISITAQSLGLGSLIIGCIRDALDGSKKDYFAKALNFPENYEFAIAIAIGHKNVSKAPHDFSFEKSVSYID